MQCCERVPSSGVVAEWLSRKTRNLVPSGAIRRVRRLITRNKRDKAELPTLTSFIRRILTPPEIHDFWHRFGPEAVVQHKTDDISRYLAGRYLPPKKPVAKPVRISTPTPEVSSVF
ncbi:predicted protein [Plenodomus lingam JN3]|uniref:Predicted protein n=1 Tax=Leptosphaeria maculans (strain JN3 / isolate v23.1.3 / race Av1-4-5-6-7-8) TaxID=985895 RepID=E4ZH87_LEPMJ|nr:predicted protein [Plenodomus lingam JN3]CBX90657.1 predicted protein [Plenodomus lingam JN3]